MIENTQLAHRDQRVRNVVAAAKLSNVEAAEQLTKVIIERRDKVVKHWITGSTRWINSIVGIDRSGARAGVGSTTNHQARRENRP